jgi:hypothetical protein
MVPDRAEASLDARLVKGQDPHKKFEQIAAFIGKQGFFLVDHEPTIEERRTHPRLAKIIDQGGYRASRTPMDLPASKALVRLMQEAKDNQTVIAPMLGGSVPMYVFEDLGLPWIGVPNRQLRQSPARPGRESPAWQSLGWDRDLRGTAGGPRLVTGKGRGDAALKPARGSQGGRAPSQKSVSRGPGSFAEVACRIPSARIPDGTERLPFCTSYGASP